MSITPRSDRSLEHSSAWTSAPAHRHATLFIEAVRPRSRCGYPTSGDNCHCLGARNGLKPAMSVCLLAHIAKAWAHH